MLYFLLEIDVVLISEVFLTKSNKKLLEGALRLGWIHEGKSKGMDGQFYTSVRKGVEEKEINKEHAAFEKMRAEI